jgi:isocitrate/isopropylmalate dehydrogenase
MLFLIIKFRTGDLGGKATNTQFTAAVIDNLKK